MKSLQKFSSTKRAHSFGIFNFRKLSKFITKQKFKDRWHLSAEGFLLLPSALRPHLSISILTILFLGVAAETFWLTDEVSAATLEITVPANYSINLDPGTSTTFGESSNQQISIKTSGSFGYTLNIKPSDGTNLKSGTNTIKTITKAEGYESSDDYKNSEEVNTWAYKPGKLNSVDNTKYLPFPSIDTILAKTNAANDVDDNYNLIIAAKVDNTLPSGTYSNNFVIAATANTVSYSITYNLNSGTWSGTSPQTGTVTDAKLILDANEPKKDGYDFMGWCSVEPTGNNTTSPSCSGQTYTAGGEYTLTNGNNNTTLNAIWKSTVPTTLQGFGNYCSSMSPEQVLTLEDTRDGEKYTVAKLKDGKCWMTQNLRVGNSNLKNRTLTTADSDVASNFVLPTSSNRGFTNYNVSYLYIDPDDTYGGYYSWYAATAGTGNYQSTSQTASNSICPKGWRMPTGSEYSTLSTSYSNNSGGVMLKSPLNFTLSGGTYDNSVGSYCFGRGSNGGLWASTIVYAKVPHFFYFDSSGVSSSCGAGLCGCSSCICYANYGLNVRCVSRN